MTVKLAFEIRYAILDSNIIFNECGPQSAGPRGWDKKRVEKRKIASEKWINTMNRKNGFYTKLEESILQDGLRNPILVVAGYCRENKLPNLPIEMQEDTKKILWCGTHGGSRLWVAQKHNLPISCIISDFIGRFSSEKLLETEEDILHHFKDTPKRITINPNGIAIKDLPQIHLEN